MNGARLVEVNSSKSLEAIVSKAGSSTLDNCTRAMARLDRVWRSHNIWFTMK